MSSRGRFFARTVLALMLGLLLASARRIGAEEKDADRAGPPAGHNLRVWQTEDGLPQNTVTSILQTRDGYLWIGTYGGLARFDGVRFQRFDSVNTPDLADGRILSLFEDAEGVLWIGHDSGTITRYSAGHFERVKSNPALANERVAAISSDGAGRLWLLRQSGALESVADGRVVPLRKDPGPLQILSLVRSAAGDLYVAADGEVSQLVGNMLQPLDFGLARNTGFVMGAGPAQTQGVWIVRDWRVQNWSGARRLDDRGWCPWPRDTALNSLLEMRDGCLAVGTMDRGLYLSYPNGRTLHYDRSNGLPQNWVRSLCEDREGNLWIGAGSAGLVQLVPVPFSVINAPDQWQGRTELSVAVSRDGALWIGTEGAGLYRYREDAWTHFGPNEGLEHPFVWSVAESPDGGIWAGTWGGGIFRMQEDRFVRAAGYDPALGPVFALQFPQEGQDMWVGSGSGLLQWSTSDDSAAPHQVGGIVARVCTVVRDPRGVLWYGISDGGLVRLENGMTQRFQKRDGLSSDSVQCLFADGDVLWIGTADGGLNRLKDGRFSTIGVDQGLASHTVCHIADDTSGHLWLSTHHGILRLSKEELNDCAEGRIAAVTGQVFDRSDGLPTIEFSGGLHAAGCRSPDGRLWFASSKGVVSVDPEQLHLNTVVPPVVLESIRIDGQIVAFAHASSSGVRLPPEHQRIEFQFTALSLTAPNKVMFKYRLAGIDAGWVDAGAKRSATYSHLPAGNYTFHVIARNNDGVWNAGGVSVGLTVLPFFWETWWFLGACAMVVFSTVVWVVRGITRRRLHRRLEDLERRHAIERERARIAQDIHDDVGASLTRISMLSQCVANDAMHPARTTEVLDTICETAGEVTRALDEIVWAVDPRHDSLDSLVCYMGKYAQDYLAPSSVRCRLDLPVLLPAWPLTAEIRHNLFLAFKEALNNALKHAAATEVRIALRLRAEEFVLSIKDNGRGLPSPDHEPGAADRIGAGNGLANMRNRLEKIGGRCDIRSLPDSGTEVSFTVGMRRLDASSSKCAPSSDSSDSK